MPIQKPDKKVEKLSQCGRNYRQVIQIISLRSLITRSKEHYLKRKINIWNQQNHNQICINSHLYLATSNIISSQYRHKVSNYQPLNSKTHLRRGIKRDQHHPLKRRTSTQLRIKVRHQLSKKPFNLQIIRLHLEKLNGQINRIKQLINNSHFNNNSNSRCNRKNIQTHLTYNNLLTRPEARWRQTRSMNLAQIKSL